MPALHWTQCSTWPPFTEVIEANCIKNFWLLNLATARTVHSSMCHLALGRKQLLNTDECLSAKTVDEWYTVVQFALHHHQLVVSVTQVAVVGCFCFWSVFSWLWHSSTPSLSRHQEPSTPSPRHHHTPRLRHPQKHTGLGTQNFYFQDRKNLKFQDIFQDIRVTKKRVFCHFRRI